jgi:hypothetical protein
MSSPGTASATSCWRSKSIRRRGSRALTAEVNDTGENLGYPDGWGFGFGSYRTEVYDGRPYRVTNYPAVNAKTIL